MGAYVYSIICAALCVALLCSLSPEHEEISKYIAFAGALAVALCILRPVSSAEGLPKLTHFTDTSEKKTEDSLASAEYTAKTAMLFLSAATGTDCENISADVKTGEDGMHVTLYCAAPVIGDISSVEEKLEEVLGIDVTVCDGGR